MKNSLTEEIKAVAMKIFNEIDADTKVAEKSVRKNTLLLASLGKQYRKDSVAYRK